MKELGNALSIFFFAFGASLKGYSYMRKTIVVDGTHLQGKYAGCLLTASAQDEDYSIFPLAFAVVDGENDKSWLWFFQQLARVIPSDDELFFVSDRHASIYAAISKVYPRSRHCACIMHLKRNIRLHFKSRNLAFMMKEAAYAYRLVDFNRIFGEIKRIDLACADYLSSIGFHNWARSHFPGPRYNLMTSNIAESWNAVIREARTYPILLLVEFIRGKLTDWFAERRERYNGSIGSLTTKVEEIISKNFEKSAGYEVRKINVNVYHIMDKKGVSFHVNLADKSCSCFAFQHLRIPCSHALAAAITAHVRVDTLVPEAFKATYASLEYKENVNPVTELRETDNLSEGVRGLNLLPPSTRCPPGRPRKRRFLSGGEFKKRGYKRTVVCTLDAKEPAITEQLAKCLSRWFTYEEEAS